MVTSSLIKNALIKLSNAKMSDFFEFVLGSDDLRNGKPHPKMYLTATERLGETSQKCLAIEDSDNGVLAACKAGLTVIQVPDLK